MNINNQTQKVFLISIGAIPGAIIRWQLDEIFIVNMIGCFLIGLFNSLYLDSKYKLIFCIGFCGTLTTFSGWISNLFLLISNGLYIHLFIATASMLTMGFCAICLGNLLAKQIKRLF